MKTQEQFLEKQAKIITAIARVESKLNLYKAESEAGRTENIRNWNEWHDLKDRLKNRLIDNWGAFHDWHFGKFGYSIYTY